MPHIRSSADLRNNCNEISTFCPDRAEPVFITKNGRGDLAVMSIETYEKMINTFQTDIAIAEAEHELAMGVELLDAREVLTALRRKYFG
mgnify:CR=1 FL=1